ncbi:MAG: metal ABC transporter permease [Planctomycetota bacterium]|nr:metal ABC transporter permease [Planctomycetota bacterium]
MGIEFWTLVISVATGLMCSLVGVLLVANREALVSEGLSHAVLPGIILAFIVLRDRSSPLLILSAGAAGLLMVVLVAALARTRLVKDDASLGVVFPALFSIGIVMASTELGNTHFHAHCIIDGNLALTPLDRLVIGGTDFGPRPAYIMVGMLLVVVAFIAVFFKELKLMVFDPLLAGRLGFRPALLHVAWLGVVSLATVSAFEVAGSILVVALMITPPAAAYLLCDDLKRMMVVSAALGVLSAVLGFYLGLALDIAPTGPMSSVAGFVFLVVLLVAPKRGLLARASRRRIQRRDLRDRVLLLQLAGAGADRAYLEAHLPWEPTAISRALDRTVRAGLVVEQGTRWRLTDMGDARVRSPGSRA